MFCSSFTGVIMLHFLVEMRERTKAISVETRDDLTNAMLTSFNLQDGTTIRFEIFSEVFGCFVDLDSLERVPDRAKN